jgi:hypothetical protein
MLIVQSNEQIFTYYVLIPYIAHYIYSAKKKRIMGKFNIYFIHFKIKFNTEKCNISKWNLAQWLSRCFCLLHWRNNHTHDIKRPLTQRQIQYLLWPPLTCKIVRTSLDIDTIKSMILTCWIMCHSNYVPLILKCLL